MDTSEYLKQAQDFLDKFRLSITKTLHTEQPCPPWVHSPNMPRGKCPECKSTHGLCLGHLERIEGDES